MMTGLELDRVLEGLEILEAQGRGQTRKLSIPKDYDVPNVSEKVVRIILSYTNYVQRVVWHKTLAPHEPEDNLLEKNA